MLGKGLTHSRCSRSLDVQVRASCGPLKFFSHDSLNHFYFVDLALCTGIIIKLEQERTFQKLYSGSFSSVSAEMNIAKLIN